jgi:hypothetical protein
MTIEQQDLIVTLNDGTIICSGRIVNHKWDLIRHCYLYSIDNRYFWFSNKNVQVELTDDCIISVEFDPSRFKLNIQPWSNRHADCDVFIEHTVYELDPEIEPLVMAINNCRLETSGSCSGHAVGASHVTVKFSAIEPLIKFSTLIRKRFSIEQVNLQVPREFSGENVFCLDLIIPMYNSQINTKVISDLTNLFSVIPPVMLK